MTKPTDKYSAAELQKKYSGYKAGADKSSSNSSFWLDSKSFQSTPGERNATDFIALAGYQRAVANFVRIVTGRTDIPVLYSSGRDSYTDSKCVVLSAKLEQKEFDTAVGLALHEGSHIAHTKFDIMASVRRFDYYQHIALQRIRDYHKENPDTVLNTDLLADLVNVIEDRRIDRITFDVAPGYRGYYTSMYAKYFNSREIDMALVAGLKNDPTNVDDYMFHIINFANPKRNLKTLPALKSIWDRIDLANINRLPDTDAVLDVAIAVYIDIYNATETARKSISDPAKKVAEDTKKEAEQQSVPKKSAKDSKKEGDSFEDENLDTMSSRQSSKESALESESDSDDDMDSDSDSADGVESESMDIKSGKTKASQGDMDSDGESENEFSTDSDSGTPSSTPTASETANDPAAEQTDTETKYSAKEQEKLLEKISRKLESSIQAQKDFLNGKINKKKLSQTDAAKVNAAAQTDAVYKGVGGEVIKLDNGYVQTVPKVDCLVVKGITKSLIDSKLLGSQCWDPVRTRASLIKADNDYIAAGIKLGTMLGKRLKTRDEERSLKSTRLESGRLDKRLIAELGFNNERVFSQINFFKSKSAHVHISIDASGSMMGTAWSSAMKTAVAIAKAASMTSSIEVVISVRGTVGPTPLIWTVYDSRQDRIDVVKNALYAVHASGSTPEGLCFEAIHQNMLRDANGKDAYFINLSDGMPSFYASRVGAYEGNLAVEHTKLQINKLRKAGIKVLSYYISTCSDQRTLQKFRTMYGKDAVNLEIDSLTVLARSLNELFERKEP